MNNEQRKKVMLEKVKEINKYLKPKNLMITPVGSCNWYVVYKIVDDYIKDGVHIKEFERLFRIKGE